MNLARIKVLRCFRLSSSGEPRVATPRFPLADAYLLEDRLRQEVLKSLDKIEILAADLALKELLIALRSTEKSVKHRTAGDQLASEKQLKRVKYALSRANRFLPIAKFQKRHKNKVQNCIARLEQLVRGGPKPALPSSFKPEHP